MLSTLRQGKADPELTKDVQAFLRGQGHPIEISGVFDAVTTTAVIDFQRQKGLKPDGIVGNMTWGAFMAAGFVVLESDESDSVKTSPNWPPKPKDLRLLTPAERFAVFGYFDYEPAPTPDNPEAIRITRRSPLFKIESVDIPLLRGVKGFPASGRVLIEESCADQVRRLVKAWDEAGLLDRVLTWGGTLAERFVRGSTTVLSAHAWGSALDINMQWNALRVRPALVGEKGSVRELVPIANELKFFWGGHFARQDGMHIEATRA